MPASRVTVGTSATALVGTPADDQQGVVFRVLDDDGVVYFDDRPTVTTSTGFPWYKADGAFPITSGKAFWLIADESTAVAVYVD